MTTIILCILGIVLHAVAALPDPAAVAGVRDRAYRARMAVVIAGRCHSAQIIRWFRVTQRRVSPEDFLSFS